MFKSSLEKISNRNQTLVFYKTLSNQSGATMVEFAIATIVVFFLLALTFDGGMAVWRYSVLTEAAALVSVDRAIHIEERGGLALNLGVAGSCGDCGALDACVTAIGRAYIDRYTSSNGLEFEAEVTTARPSAGVDPTGFIQIQGTWDIPCFFCPMFDGSFELFVAESSPLESAEIRCE